MQVITLPNEGGAVAFIDPFVKAVPLVTSSGPVGGGCGVVAEYG